MREDTPPHTVYHIGKLPSTNVQKEIYPMVYLRISVQLKGSVPIELFMLPSKSRI